MHKTRRRRPVRAGFTLMEVLLVLAILVILGGTVTFYFAGVFEGGKRDAAKAQIEMFKDMLELYRMHVGQYPTSGQGLNALHQQPGDLPNPQKWKGPYTSEEIPLDPWDRPYQYQLVAPDQFQIWSNGADGSAQTQDDVKG